MGPVPEFAAQAGTDGGRGGYKIRVDLGPVAAKFGAGHQLRVEMSGADFPLYDRNPNTAAGIFGSETVVATEAGHHGPGALSRIVLPVR